MSKPLLLFTLVSAFAVCCFGQKESLLIGPGDTINVQVFDTPEMDQTVRVTDQGSAPLEFVGDVPVAGHTPGEAARLIEQALIRKQVMLHPQVKVNVDEFGTQKVSVIGQVANPGSYPFTTPQPITRVISEAGGLTGIADPNITIERHGTGQKVKYYLANNADQALNDSVLVNPGDTVVIPKAPVVYVMGDVARPGGYPITTNDSKITVLQALALAGSANKTAVKKHIRLIRKTGSGESEVPIQLAAMEEGKKPDMELESNDILYIPFSWAKNIAVGAASIAASTGGAAIYAIH